MLTLPIKRQWFDMIRSGEKTEEYRTLNSYYATRFKKLFNLSVGDTPPPEGTKPQKLLLRNGYSGKSPTIEIEASLKVKEGRPEWGATPGVRYYALCITKVSPVLSI